MGIGTLRMHRAWSEPAVGAVPSQTREQLLEQHLAEERARSAALLAETIELRAAAKASAPAPAPAPVEVKSAPVAEPSPAASTQPAPRPMPPRRAR